MSEVEQAFPDGLLNEYGMTLRDYFAAKATDDDVKEYQTGRKIKEVPRKDGLGNLRFSETVYYTRDQAKYRYADAMLCAREEK
jgi:hypothetical protein